MWGRKVKFAKINRVSSSIHEVSPLSQSNVQYRHHMVGIHVKGLVSFNILERQLEC